MTDYSELVKRLRACAALTTSPELIREAADAIEALERRIEIMRTFADVWNGLANECMKRLEKLSEAMPKWIPVTERLPQYGDWVLGIGPKRGYHVCEYRGITHFPYGGDSPWFSAKGRTLSITHWMPLPDPPEEET